MTEQPIDRLRRICKIEGVSIHDDAAVIKLCGEYMDGDALLTAYRELSKAEWMQAAIDSGLIAKPYNAPTNGAMSACSDLNRFSREDEDMSDAVKISIYEDIRRALEMAEAMKAAGIMFVPVPVSSDAEAKQKMKDVLDILDKMEELAE